MMKKCLLLMTVISLSCSVSAYYSYFDGGAGTTNWFDGANWQYDGVPNSGVAARIGAVLTETSDITVDIIDATAITDGMQIGYNTWGPYIATLNVIGTNPTEGSYCALWLGGSDMWLEGGRYGVLNVNGNSVVSTYNVDLTGLKINIFGSEYGTFRISGDDWKIQDDSYITINDGAFKFDSNTSDSFSAYDGDLGYNPYFTGTIDVAGGKIKLTGDDRSEINWHINNGNIIAYGGDSSYNLEVTYDGTYTWVEAVPDSVYAAMPSDGATDVDPNTSLSWTVSPDVLSGTLYLGQRPQADLSGNDIVDIEDLSILAVNYLDSSIAALDAADITHDLNIDLDDFALMAQQWQSQTVLTPVHTFTNDGSNGPFVYTPAVPLDSDTEYFWRVDATTASETLTGDLWRFETLSSDPTIYLTFDDRFVSEWVAAMPIFEQYGAKATFCVSHFDELTSDQITGLHTLEAAGHAIACHSLNHLAAVDYVNSHSLEQYWLDDVKPALDLMVANGFDPQCFAYPGSQNNDETDQMLLQYFKYLRSGVAFLEMSGMLNDPVEMQLGGCFYSTSVDSDNPDVTIEDIYALFDLVKAQKASIVLHGHSIAEETSNPYYHYVQPQRLHNILSYGTSIGLRFKTLD